jgi:hypothetical protein
MEAIFSTEKSMRENPYHCAFAYRIEKNRWRGKDRLTQLIEAAKTPADPISQHSSYKRKGGRAC